MNLRSSFLSLLVLPTVLLMSFGARAETVAATEETTVDVTLLGGFTKIPDVGDFGGTVTSEYVGTAFGLYKYKVTVFNKGAACEGDDCMVTKVFDLSAYKGHPVSVNARQIDKSNYLVEIKTFEMVVSNDDGDLKPVPVKLLLQVTFTKDDIASKADLSVIYKPLMK
jgi:hypothetical protein